ncbi:hypothetical protein TCAL_08800 [Tigriopus californicus]|uniref:Potassium channel domain-containing protein n=1 Tax=Tigriopus californicus TaxID=6832 RepID=A0A553P623_TIGCA|nr:hypothetical protein TCAL_08800 [Tigriopus californicus]
MARKCQFNIPKKFEPHLAQIKKVFNHLGLYLGLILYTAVGAWIFILIEHPVEREKMDTLQTLLNSERKNFLNLVYNLTSQLDVSSSDNIDLYSEETIKSMLLATNSFRPHWQNHEFHSLEKVVKKLDSALLDYEKTVAVAAGEGINMTSKLGTYKWTYVQSVFFTSTIITTVGYGHIAPSTVGGRVFCILFAIIGIPFTLSVIADVGQITATLISVVWAKSKPVVCPLIERIREQVKKYMKRKRTPRPRLTDNDDDDGNALEESDDPSEDEEEDPMESSFFFVDSDNAAYMMFSMIYILLGLAITSTIIELVRRQYAESWSKMQELRAQIQAQLKLADHLRKMAEQGKDLEGMDVDLEELRRNLEKFKKGRLGKFFGDFNIDDLDWINKRKVKAVTIFFYETSV